MDRKRSWAETVTLVGQWRAERPVRRQLRTWNVLTMLATAGLMLSIAALLVLIGLGETQIIASEGRSADLFGNRWFDVGLVVAGVGMFWGMAAIASIGSQSKARREFPAVEIEIIAGGINPSTLPPGTRTTFEWYSQLIGVRITNRELRRSANLKVRLKCRLTPGFGAEKELRLSPRWQDENAGGLGGSLPQLRDPILLEPQSTIEGYMVFDFMNVSPHITDDRQLEFMDHNCGRAVAVDPKLGSVYDFT
jgi:hypothetical protein